MNVPCEHFIPTTDRPCASYVRPKVKREPGFCQRPNMFRCVEAMKRKLPAISYSSATDFIRCRRSYYHRVVEGLQVRPEHLPESMKLGKAWDLYTHHLYSPDFDHLPKIEALRLTPEQQAKVNALIRAHRDLEVSANKDGLLGCQYEVLTSIGQTNIHGFVDRAYQDHIVEVKLSSRPEFYTERENISYQLGTYFLGNEAWQYGIVEAVRVPQLRTSYGKFSDEDPAKYEARLLSEIVSRPSHYFLGWNRQTRTYGVKFWRSEFDLDEIFRTFGEVLQEIQECAQRGHWWENHLACHVPGPCPYLPIKRTRVVSDEIYERREVKTNEKG